ncbi:MAG: ABC transporter substrate-binding protein [Lachnospiraceae bacterium]|nr:ABC transporter substrate-binding protein [Lachnospiraceae bacterium]
MMRRKRMIGAALSLAVSAMSLCGCADKTIVNEQQKQTTISFSWWGNEERNEYTMEAIDAFERLHPEIKVDYYFTEWSGYQTRNDIKMASNTESDVMQINYAWITQYSPTGEGYYDIGELAEYIDLSNFTEKEINYGMQKGHLNALPIALNTETFYFNETLFEEYQLSFPKTWDDLFAIASKIPEDKFVLGMPQKSVWMLCAAYAEQKNGKQFISADGELKFNAKDIEDMLDFYCRAVDARVMPGMDYYEKSNIGKGIYLGYLAWISDAGSYSADAVKNGYTIVATDYLTVDGGALTGWYAKPATMYAIGKNTEHPKEAAMLLDFLLNSEEMAKCQGLEKGIPLSTSALTVLSEEGMLEGIQYEAYEKMMEYDQEIAIMSPYHETQSLIDAFSDACNAVYYDVKTLEEAAKELETEFTKILRETRGE